MENNFRKKFSNARHLFKTDKNLVPRMFNKLNQDSKAALLLVTDVGDEICW